MEKTSSTETAEIRELRAQVRSLQSENARLRDSRSKRTGTAKEGAQRARQEDQRRADQREISDRVRDVLDRGGDESSRLMRAVVLGGLKHVELWAREVEDFTRRVNDRNEPGADDTVDDIARRLPTEVASEFLESVRRSFDFPQLTVDRIRNSYDETEDLQTRGKHGEPSTTGAAPRSASGAVETSAS